MIKIERHEKKLRVRIETGVHGVEGNEIWLYWNCDSEMYAQLLRNHIDSKLDETIQAIRQEEYEKGWKDAKGHKTKKAWFSPLIKKFLS